MDALVLDIQARQAMRANDVWLGPEHSALLLTAIDASPWAVVRRLGRGLFGKGTGRHLIDWKYVEFLRGDPRAALAGRDNHRGVATLPPPEIARLMDAIPYLHAAELLTFMPDPVAADTIEEMTAERQLQVFEELDHDQGTRLLVLMAPDAAADLVGRLQPDTARHYVEGLPDEQRHRIIDLLRYPEDTAGGIMTNDIVVAPAAMTVKEAHRVLADQLKSPDFVYYIFVVDSLQERRLRGMLTLRDLYVAADSQRLEEIMRPNLQVVHPLAPAAHAARRLSDTHFAALPVVGTDGVVLGAVTVDAAVAQLVPDSFRDQTPKVFS